MASQSILASVKKVCGVGESDTSFDDEIVFHTNAVFSTLNQLGIGPSVGFEIDDSTPTWDAFLGDDPRYNFVKSYVHLRVRLLFDTPATSFAIESHNAQIKELEWRMNVLREEESWVDPTL